MQSTWQEIFQSAKPFLTDLKEGETSENFRRRWAQSLEVHHRWFTEGGEPWTIEGAYGIFALIGPGVETQFFLSPQEAELKAKELVVNVVDRDGVVKEPYPTVLLPVKKIETAILRSRQQHKKEAEQKQQKAKERIQTLKSMSEEDFSIWLIDQMTQKIGYDSYNTGMCWECAVRQYKEQFKQEPPKWAISSSRPRLKASIGLWVVNLACDLGRVLPELDAEALCK